MIENGAVLKILRKYFFIFVRRNVLRKQKEKVDWLGFWRAMQWKSRACCNVHSKLR